MKKLILKYGYIFYMLIISLTMVQQNLMKSLIWTTIIFLSIEFFCIPAQLELYKNKKLLWDGYHLYDRKWWERNLWTAFLGMMPHFLGFPIVTIGWWIIVVPTFLLVFPKLIFTIMDDIKKTKEMEGIDR